MFDYGYSKERGGFMLWALKPWTGDRRDALGLFRTRRQVEEVISRLRAGDKSALAYRVGGMSQ
jgi:hypothetical protein